MAAPINQAISDTTVHGNVVNATGSHNMIDASQHITNIYHPQNEISRWLGSQEILPQTLKQAIANRGLRTSTAILNEPNLLNLCDDEEDRSHLEKFLQQLRNQAASNAVTPIRQKLKQAIKTRDTTFFAEEFVDVRLAAKLNVDCKDHVSSSLLLQQQQQQSTPVASSPTKATSQQQQKPASPTEAVQNNNNKEIIAPPPPPVQEHVVQGVNLITHLEERIQSNTLSLLLDNQKKSVSSPSSSSSTANNEDSNNNNNIHNNNNTPSTLSSVAVVESDAHTGKTFLLKQLVLSQPGDAPFEEGIRIFCPFEKLKVAVNVHKKPLKTRADLINICCGGDNHVLEKEDIDHIINDPIKVVFLFDSFDSVQESNVVADPTTGENINDFAKFLHNFIDPVTRFNNTNNKVKELILDTDLVIVSSRKQRIENSNCNFNPVVNKNKSNNNVNVLHFSMKLWIKPEVEQFTRNFFQHHFNSTDDEQNLRVKRTVVKVTSSLRKGNNNMDHFSGIPYMMKMLCEMVKEDSSSLDQISPSIAFEKMISSSWKNSASKIQQKLQSENFATNYNLDSKRVTDELLQRVLEKAMEAAFLNVIVTNSSSSITDFTVKLEKGISPLFCVLLSETSLMRAQDQSMEEMQFSTPLLVQYLAARHIFEDKSLLVKLPWIENIRFVWIFLADLLMNGSDAITLASSTATAAASSAATNKQKVTISDFITAAGNGFAAAFTSEVQNQQVNEPAPTLCLYLFMRIAMILREHSDDLLNYANQKCLGIKTLYWLRADPPYAFWLSERCGQVGALCVYRWIENTYPTSLTDDVKRNTLTRALDCQDSNASINFVAELIQGENAIPISLSHSVKCNSLAGTSVAASNAIREKKFDPFEWSKLLRFALSHHYYEVAGVVLLLAEDEWKKDVFNTLHLIVALLPIDSEVLLLLDSFPFTRKEIQEEESCSKESKAFVSTLANNVMKAIIAKFPSFKFPLSTTTKISPTSEISRTDFVKKLVGVAASEQNVETSVVEVVLSPLELIVDYSNFVKHSATSFCFQVKMLIELGDKNNDRVSAALEHLFSLKDVTFLADNVEVHNVLVSAFFNGLVQTKISVMHKFCRIIAVVAKASEKNVFGSKEIRNCLTSFCVSSSASSSSASQPSKEKEQEVTAVSATTTSSSSSSLLLTPETAQAWCTAVANILEKAEENKKSYGKDNLVHLSLLQIIPSIKTSKAANAWFYCVYLLAGYKPNLPKFDDDEIKDAFVKISETLLGHENKSETLLSSDAATSFSRAIGQICKENIECKTRFGLDEKIRDALVAVSTCIDTEEHAPSWLNVVLSLVSFSPEVTKLYAVEKFRDAFVNFYNRLTKPTSAIADSTATILSHLIGVKEQRHLFATTQIRDLLGGESLNCLAQLVGTAKAAKCWLQTLLQIISDTNEQEENIKLFATKKMINHLFMSSVSQSFFETATNCNIFLVCLRKLTSIEVSQEFVGTLKAASIYLSKALEKAMSDQATATTSVESFVEIVYNLATSSSQVVPKIREFLCDTKLVDALISVCQQAKTHELATQLVKAVLEITIAEKNRNAFATKKFDDGFIRPIIGFLPSSSLRYVFQLMKQLVEGDKNRLQVFVGGEARTFSNLITLRNNLKSQEDFIVLLNALTALSIDNAAIFNFMSTGYNLKNTYEQLKKVFVDVAAKDFWNSASSSSHSEAAEAWLRCLFTINQKNENNKQHYGNPTVYVGTCYCHELASSLFKIGTKHATTNTTVKLVCDIIYDFCEDPETNKECSVVVGNESASLKYATTHWTVFSSASYIDGRKLVLASTPSATMIPDLFVALARAITDISAATSWVRSLNHLCSFYEDHKKHFTENAKCRQSFCSISRFLKQHEQQQENTSASSNSSSSNQADKTFVFIFSWSQCLVSLLATKESQQHFLADTGAELAFALKDLAVSIVENSSSSSSSEKQFAALKWFLTAMFTALHFYSKLHDGVSVQSCESQYLFFNELNLDCLVKIVDVIFDVEQSEQKHEVCKLWLLCLNLFAEVSSRAADKIRLGNDADIYITLKKLCSNENKILREKFSAIQKIVNEEKQGESYRVSIWVKEKLNSRLLME